MKPLGPINSIITYVFYGATVPSGPGPPHYINFTITLKTVENWTGLLCMSDQPDAHTSTRQHPTPTRDNHFSGGIRTRKPNKRTAADPRLRPRVN
jgi:hypothetical protein